MSTVAGRRALVTGGARRLGRALALGLAAAGCDVAIHHGSSPVEAEDTAAACRALGARAEVVRADLAAARGCRAAVRDAERALGGIDILVSSAANFVRGGLMDLDEEALERALAVNLRAPIWLAQAVVPGMRERGWGRIVLLSDVAGLRPWPHYLAHSAAKAAVGAITQALAADLAPEILVNAIAPGPVLMPDGSSPEAVARSAATTALGRVGSPEDVAGALRYLVEADYVTGHMLVVDGGRMVAR